jgi:hypothetical protein
MKLDRSIAATRWQQTVEGTWHGWPAIFDASGTHRGFVQADRRIELEGGAPVIRVKTSVEVDSILRWRLEHDEHVLHVEHLQSCRVYVGPDFYGAGYPFGHCLIGTDYCVPWASDNRVMVQVLPDGQTQAYCTLLYRGPTLHAVINGIYKLRRPGDDSDDTNQRIAAHIAHERAHGSRPHILCHRGPGRFVGQVQIFDAEQGLRGTSEASLSLRPVGAMRAEGALELGGELDCSLRFARSRHENLYYYEGPDLWGNGIAYGRALYTTQHLRGQPARIRGREFLIDGSQMLVVAWEFLREERLEHMVFGVLSWEAL